MYLGVFFRIKIFKETTEDMKDLGNQAPFMRKELRKQIMKRSKSKNVYSKWPYCVEISWPIKIKKANETTWPNMLKWVFLKNNSQKW